MSNEEKLINYLTNKMDKSEMDDFEEELKSSPKLRNDLESYKKLFNLVEETKNIPLSNHYTQTIIPEFRSRQERKRKISFISKYGFALAFLFVFVVSYSIINNLMQENQNPKDLYTNLTNDDADFLAEKLNLDFSKDLDSNAEVNIDSVYNEDLDQNINSSLSDQTFQSYSKDLSIKDLDQYLTENDVDIIYSELLNKKIL